MNRNLWTHTFGPTATLWLQGRVLGMIQRATWQKKTSWNYHYALIIKSEDDFPFPNVGYVSSLEGIHQSLFNLRTANTWQKPTSKEATGFTGFTMTSNSGYTIVRIWHPIVANGCFSWNLENGEMPFSQCECLAFPKTKTKLIVNVHPASWDLCKMHHGLGLSPNVSSLSKRHGVSLGGYPPNVPRIPKH